MTSGTLGIPRSLLAPFPAGPDAKRADSGLGGRTATSPRVTRRVPIGPGLLRAAEPGTGEGRGGERGGWRGQWGPSRGEKISPAVPVSRHFLPRARPPVAGSRTPRLRPPAPPAPLGPGLDRGSPAAGCLNLGLGLGWRMGTPQYFQPKRLHVIIFLLKTEINKGEQAAGSGTRGEREKPRGGRRGVETAAQSIASAAGPPPLGRGRDRRDAGESGARSREPGSRAASSCRGGRAEAFPSRPCGCEGTRVERDPPPAASGLWKYDLKQRTSAYRTSPGKQNVLGGGAGGGGGGAAARPPRARIRPHKADPIRLFSYIRPGLAQRSPMLLAT